MKRGKQDRDPPRLAERLLEWSAPNGRTGQSVVGDAREEFSEHLRSDSAVPPVLWYWLYVLPIVAHGIFLGLERAPGALPGALGAIARDVRLALRTLVRRPGLAVAVIATLGVGIGGTTVAFSILNASLLSPLPFEDPDGLVGIYRLRTDGPGGFPPARALGQSYAVSPMTFRDWANGARGFESMGAFEGAVYSLATPEGPVRISGAHATSGTFRAFGVPPLMGRTFLPEEDEIGGARVAVVSAGFWERVLGSDPAVLGRPLSLNGVPHTVVGVMPQGFDVPTAGVEVWVPLPDDRRGWASRNGGFLQVVGRLAGGVTMDQAQVELTALHERMAADHDGERDRTARVYSWRELQVAGSRSGILLVVCASGMVLLIACANITNLLLVRALERDRELAVREALGAGRAHLVAQLGSEACVLALLGGGAAVLLAMAGTRPLLSVLPVSLPNAAAIRVDGVVLAFAGILALATGFGTGLLPALRVFRPRSGWALRDVGRGRAGAGRRRTSSVLAAAEMALAFVLLSGAALSLRSFLETAAVDPGFEFENRLAMRVELPAEYKGDGGAVSLFFGELTRRLSDRPDVAAAGSASQMPYSGGVSFPPASVETNDGLLDTNVHNSSVTPGYFQAAGMTVTSGRPLTEDDRAGTPPVAVVNEAMALAFWPGERPIGRRVRLDLPGDSVWRTVVGVVEDVRYGFGWTTFPEFYTTVAQRPLEYQTVLVHVARAPDAVAEAMRQTLWSMNGGIPATVTSGEALAARSRGFTSARFASQAMTMLAALAGLLALVGVYGVVAFTVRAKRHEFGVRVALGGTPPAILRSVLERGFRISAAGVVAGLGVVLTTGRFLDPALFSSGTGDPLTLGVVTLVVLGTGVGASLLPAFRATRVDPVKTLGTE